MKIYKLSQLKAMCTQQGYKLARLENSQGETMTSYNKITKPISGQFNVIQKRLNSEILPDGIYYVCLAPTIQKSSNPDKYPIQKGKENSLQQHNNGLNNHNHTFQLAPESLLTSESALKLLTEISDLKAENSRLKLENQYLQQELDEAEEEGLAENKTDTKTELFKVIQESAPALVGGLSEYFKLENRKVDLEESKLALKKKAVKTTRSFQRIEPGTSAHLALIEMYDKQGKDDKLEREIEKIKAINEPLYNQLMEKYFEQEEEVEEEEQQEGGGKDGQ